MLTEAMKAKRAARKAREAARRLKRKQKREAKAAPKKALASWSALIRAEGKCAVCGKSEHLNAHHILPKERYPEFRTEIKNGIALCPTHHKYGRFSAHRNAVWFVSFLMRARTEQALWAMDRMGRDDSEIVEEKP